MGIECADFDNDGMPSIVIGNFLTEPSWVYKLHGTDSFVERASEAGSAFHRRMC